MNNILTCKIVNMDIYCICTRIYMYLLYIYIYIYTKRDCNYNAKQLALENRS